MSNKFELDICQGKYRYIYENGKQTALRHGEPWPSMDQELVGNKFVFSLATELHEKTQRLDSVMETLATLADKLGIDFEAAQKAPGKPSDVFFSYIDTRLAEERSHGQRLLVALDAAERELFARNIDDGWTNRTEFVPSSVLSSAQSTSAPGVLGDQKPTTDILLAEMGVREQRLREFIKGLPDTRISEQPEWDMSENNGEIWRLYLDRVCSEALAHSGRPGAAPKNAEQRVLDNQESATTPKRPGLR